MDGLKRFFLMMSFFVSLPGLAHEGLPNMAFALRNGNIEVDTARQGISLGDYKAFVISFNDLLTPYRMGDAGFTGFGFDRGGFVSYQTESTLFKWSEQAASWLADGYSEQLVISRLAVENRVTAQMGNGQQGFISSLSNSSSFEAHPVFFMESENSDVVEDGAYMVFLRILALDETGTVLNTQPSEPFALIFHINAQSSFDEMALSQALEVVPDVQLNDYALQDALFDWAESELSVFFPHEAKSRFMFGFYGRCYENSVCVGVKDGKVFTAGGILGELTEQGALELFSDMAGL